MHLAIQEQTSHYTHLFSTPRKRLLKSQLLRVKKGLVLAKLGKKEYALSEGESLWLPFNCLCSVTFMPSTQVQLVEVSSRLTLRFSKQAGYVALNPLLSELLNSLYESKRSDAHRQAILSLIKFELTQLKPQLIENALTTAFHLQSPSLSADYLAALKVRQALKYKLSGQSVSAIVSELFDNDEEAFKALCLSVLGQPL